MFASPEVSRLHDDEHPKAFVFVEGELVLSKQVRLGGLRVGRRAGYPLGWLTTWLKYAPDPRRLTRPRPRAAGATVRRRQASRHRTLRRGGAALEEGAHRVPNRTGAGQPHASRGGEARPLRSYFPPRAAHRVARQRGSG